MSKRTVHYCLALVSAGLMVMTSGCGVETPFARNIDDVNLKGEQLPARIQLSDAQVFSREALINDRLREVAFLKKLIDEETVRHQFEPQLQRDLTHITTMAAQLGIGFNPGVGLQNEQALDQNERLHDIQMKKLDIELKRLQRELEALDQGGEATALSDTSPTPLTDPPSADTKAVLDQLGNLNAQVADLLKRPFRESKTKASPEHIYRDWQAYRAELRADEQAARLDDIHDSEGKTLYRMQFTATILPGQEKDKFGIALVDVKPPVLNDRQLNRLYYDWLKHVNARLNIVSDKGIVPDLLYQRLGRSTDLFRYVYAAINRRNPDGEVVPATFRIAVHPEVSSFVQLYVCRAYVSTTDPIPPQSIDAPAGIPATSLMERVCKGHWSIIKESLKPRTGTQTASPGKGRIVAFARQTLGKRASKTIDADSDTDIDDEATAKTNACHTANSVEAAILAFNRVIDTPGSGFDLDEESLVAFSDLAIGAYDKDQGELECSNEEMLDLPNGFLETVLPEMDGSDPFALRGSTSAYAAMPVERAQRLSTVASAANAMQLAMSLSAVLPAQGLSVNGGAAYQEIAMGTIDALERAPLVVGFADRGAPTNDKADNRARFGWLFGPPIRVDTENDRLVHRHVVANHRVLADMSVPAWWPSVTLKVHSAWIGNWDDPDEAIASASEFERRGRDRFMDVEKEARETSCGKRPANQFCQEIQVELPQTSADFHALTNKLAGAVLRQPLRAPSIDRIVPSAVTACAGEVQFFVYGNELWRAPIATLRGMRAKTPEVLPDMAGIAVTFDINSLPASPTPQLPDRLWIVTQNGPVGETITTAGDRTKPAENCGVKASAPKLALKLASSPVLDQSAPSSLSFKVTNGELPKAYHSLLMELKPVNPPDTEPQQEPLLVSDNRKMLKTKAFSVPTPAQRAAEMTDPSLVASIKVQLSPPYSDVLKPAVLAKDIRLLRCSSERTCLHTLVEPVSVSDPNDSIKIVLRVPRGYGRIYPGLGTGTSFLGAYIDYFENGVAKRIDLLPAAVEFPKDEAWRTDRESEVIAVLGPPLDENNRVDPQYENLLKSQGAKLRLRWVMSEGADAPEIPDLDILLQL